MMLSLLAAFYGLFRSRFTSFSKQVCNHVDKITGADFSIVRVAEAETLYSKIGMKLEKLEDVTGAMLSRQERDCCPIWT